MKLTKCFLTKNPCYQANLRRADSRYTGFQTRGPMGLMLHSVGCAQPSAEVFARRWDTDQATACVHAFVDANTGQILQTLPWSFRGWHGGGSCNNTHIGVEMCEPDAIRYDGGGRFTVLDRERAALCARRTYAAAVELFAHLCAVFGLDPMKDICSHAEGYTMGIATNHGDPEHLWRGLGLEYTMDGFRRDTAAFGKEHSMTQAQLEAFVDGRIVAAIGPRIEHIGDLTQSSLIASVRQLLDCGAVNGGTPYDQDPDDIRLPYSTLRSVLISKKYTDLTAEALRQELGKNPPGANEKINGQAPEKGV